jgi:hypothetical protein
MRQNRPRQAFLDAAGFGGHTSYRTRSARDSLNPIAAGSPGRHDGCSLRLCVVPRGQHRPDR